LVDAKTRYKKGIRPVYVVNRNFLLDTKLPKKEGKKMKQLEAEENADSVMLFKLSIAKKKKTLHYYANSNKFDWTG